MNGVGILQTASYVPLVINTNAEVCKNVPGMTEEWIMSKLGIKQRWYVSANETASSMSILIAKRLLLKDGFPNIDPSEIGLIIIASFSQDYVFPPMSAKIHQAIGAPKHCQVIDINGVCTGLITASTVAVDTMKGNPKIKYAMVIGVEILSRFTDKTDRNAAPFFSDGASGVLLGRMDEGIGHLNSFFCTDSTNYEDVRLKRGGLIEHEGHKTWTQAVTNMPYAIKELLKDEELEISEVDFFIFHQANKVLIEYVLDKLRIPREKSYMNVEEIGNTGAASIGIALHEAIEKRLIKSGDLVVLAGVGAGFNFGANLWRML
jgi:3-oxoacyl-[acyl-carrier-protein] synthase III